MRVFAKNNIIKITPMKMNKIAVFSLLLLFLPLIIVANVESDKKKNSKDSEAASINWISIDEAQELSKKEPRKVIVDVYTDWCGWCKKMDKSTFSDAEVVNYINEYFYAVKLNAESKDVVSYNGTELTKRELAGAFQVRSYPTIVIIDEAFETVFPIPGYRSAKDLKNILTQIKDQKPNKNKK